MPVQPGQAGVKRAGPACWAGVPAAHLQALALSNLTAPCLGFLTCKVGEIQHLPHGSLDQKQASGQLRVEHAWHLVSTRTLRQQHEKTQYYLKYLHGIHIIKCSVMVGSDVDRG